MLDRMKRARRRGLRLSGVMLLALCPLASAHAVEGGRSIDALMTGQEQTAPPGFINYCMGTPSHCQPSAGQRLRLDRRTFAEILGVQHAVQAAMVPEEEPPARDWWRVGGASGDCEDFALTKEAALSAAGLPAGAMRLATAYTEQAAYHTVLTVETDRGTLVLDNRFAEPRFWQELPYRWVSIETPEQPFRWSRLEPGLRLAAG